MARKIKSFSASKEEKLVEVEPIPFELEGEEFEAYGDVPGAVLLEFIEFAGSSESSDNAKGISMYLKASMDDANYKRFRKLIHDPVKKVKLERLSEITSYLIEERSTRPTEASSE